MDEAIVAEHDPHRRERQAGVDGVAVADGGRADVAALIRAQADVVIVVLALRGAHVGALDEGEVRRERDGHPVLARRVGRELGGRGALGLVALVDRLGLLVAVVVALLGRVDAGGLARGALRRGGRPGVGGAGAEAQLLARLLVREADLGREDVGVGLDLRIEVERLDELVAGVFELFLAAREHRAERRVQPRPERDRAGPAAALDGGAELLLGRVEAGLQVVVVEGLLEGLLRPRLFRSGRVCRGSAQAERAERGDHRGDATAGDSSVGRGGTEHGGGGTLYPEGPPPATPHARRGARPGIDRSPRSAERARAERLSAPSRWCS